MHPSRSYFKTNITQIWIKFKAESRTEVFEYRVKIGDERVAKELSFEIECFHFEMKDIGFFT